MIQPIRSQYLDGSGPMKVKKSGQEAGEVFRITDLACFLGQYVGEAGVVVYSLGFIAAALSSMLTTPLGAALTADSVFSEPRTGEGDELRRNSNLASHVVSVSPSLETEALLPRKLPHRIYLGIMFVMVVIATIVISANGQFFIYI